MLKKAFPFFAAATALGVFCFAEQPTSAPAEHTHVTESGLIIIEQGTDDVAATKGDKVTVHYTGRLENGTVFDSSLPRSEPFTFTLGGGQVIKGWEEGVAGMKCGQKRQLIIPAKLGYGEVGAPPTIPGGATLIFDVQVLYITRTAKSASDIAK